NTDGAATYGPRQAITTDVDGVAILRAADLDADGDIGVYASSSETDTLAGWENDGDGASWTRRTIDDAADGIWGVIAADPNGDGQVDLVGATAGAGAVGVWTGGGGQFALPTSAVAPALVADGVVASVLAIDATHRGRAGDSMAELATVELRVEDALGNALDDAQIDALLTRLAIHRDDGSGAFDAANDVEIGALTTFASVDDALSVPIADGQAAAQFAFGAPARVFVVATFENDASASGVGAIRFVHVTEASSTAEDASADLPIRLESSANVATDPVDFNVAPVAQDDAVALLEDAVGAAGNVLDGTAGGLDTDVNATPLTATLVDPPMHGALVGGLQPDGSFTYAPSADFNGVDQFTYRASDGLAPSNLATVTLTVQAVNDAPSFAVSGLASAAEDAGAQTVPGFATGIRAGPADEAGQVLLFTVTGNDQPGLFAVAPALASDGTLTYTSAPDVSGTATVTVRLTDDGGTANGGVDQSAEQSFDIVIDPVNDAPSFALGAGQHDALEDAGAQTVPGFATAIRAGPADEIGQVLTFTVTGNDNPGLFSAPPALAADGTLTYAGAPDASGTARITVRLADDGGTASGGVDQSDPQSFDIVIAAVNDAPSFIAAAADASGEDGGPQTVTGFATGISAGPTDEAGQGLTFAVMGNSNPGLFAAAPALASDGTLTYAGAPDASGVAQISVVLMDDGGVANGGVDASPAQIFDIVIDPINDPPSFDLAAQDATNEDAGPQTVPGFATALRAGPPDESGQTLSFSVTANTQPTLFATPPALAADGTLTYAAAPDANGTATITVVLMDSGGVAGGGVDTSPPQTFDVAIAAVNDAPSFSVPASTTVAATAAPQSIPGFAQMISAGPIDEAGQVLSFAITGNTQPGLFDVAPAIASDGALTFTLAAGASGTVAQLTAVLTDDGGTDLGGVDTSDPRVFALVVPDVTLPQVVALEALPGGAVETCAELRQPFDRLRVRFSETMADPLGDGDPADVTNAANYQLIASGPDRDIATLACDALEGDDVRIAVDGAVAIGDDARRGGAPTEVELTFDRLLPDGPYRLLVCDALEDDAGNALAATVDATFRVRADSLFVNGALDCDLDAWTITDDVQPAGVYSPEDVDDAEISGSILLTGQPGMRFAIGQCLTDASSIYDLSLAVRIDGAAEVRVQADVNCEGFTGAQCDGASLGSSVESFVLAPSGGAWQTLEHAASGGRSALCGVDLQLISGSSFEAYVDRLAASVILLNDGFESGDTAAWSATVP
ncbi:MAG: Ig-like domain-containing protein, partial [Acidobacteriota bacterium]